ncbi:undecaprenyl/decaprenyl-phosphate alpha-N-acetylglucosaminyl 1-phosphate transferase, partial [Streptomyces sp. NPDC051582]
VLLLLPRFTPRAPRWAEGLVPPRYRHAERAAEAAALDASGREPEPAEPVRVGATVDVRR